jgi:hypothetical protein
VRRQRTARHTYHVVVAAIAARHRPMQHAGYALVDTVAQQVIDESMN